MVEIVKETKKEERSVEKFFKNKTNIWIIVSAVLAIALIVAIAMPRGITGNVAADNL